MNLEELRALLAVLRDHGVTRYEAAGVAIQLEPQRQAAPVAPERPAPREIPEALRGVSPAEQARLLALHGSVFGDG